MEISVIVNIILCILSFVLAVISVVTVVITLRQNHRMIQNSTRPYVVAEAKVTNFQNPTFYLIIKNYGNSGATITEFFSSIDLQKVSFRDELSPFEHISGAFLAPGQVMSCSLDALKFKPNNVRDFTIKISYSDGSKEYKEEYPINFSAFSENVNTRAATKGEELKIISYTLQDLVEKLF